MQCLDATFTVVGPNGERKIPAREFYEAAYMTGREDDEVMTAVSFAKPAGVTPMKNKNARSVITPPQRPQFRLSRMAEPVPARRLP